MPISDKSTPAYLAAVGALQKSAAIAPSRSLYQRALAMHYLSTGKKGDALEQARVLAKIDDSYIIEDSLQKAYILERQPPGYISRITGSYLFGALEIAWRVSKDPDVVKGIAPDTPDAAPVVRFFINSRF